MSGLHSGHDGDESGGTVSIHGSDSEDEGTDQMRDSSAEGAGTSGGAAASEIDYGAGVSPEAQDIILSLIGANVTGDGARIWGPPRGFTQGGSDGGSSLLFSSAADSVAPVWASKASNARNLIASMKMKTIVPTTSQQYVTASGDVRTEEATMVQVSFGAPRWGARVPVLVTLTKAKGASRKKIAANVHVCESLDSAPSSGAGRFKIQPVLIANLSDVESGWGGVPGSFIVRRGDHMVVSAINRASDDIYISKESAKKLGPWHLELIVVAVTAHIDTSFLELTNVNGAKDVVRRIRKCVALGREGGIGGIPLLMHQCPLALWHPHEDGSSVDGLAVSEVKCAPGKKRKKAPKPSLSLSSSSSSSSSLSSSLSFAAALQGTAVLLDALARLGVEATVKTRVGSKASKVDLAKATKAVATASKEGHLVGISFCSEAVLLPNEVFALVLKYLGWEQSNIVGPAVAQKSRYYYDKLNQRELVIVVPRVAKSWLAAAQDPDLHKSFEHILPSTINMTTLIEVLKRPKFALVERISFSHKMKLGASTSKKFTEACPNLRHADLGCHDNKCHPSDEMLAQLLVCAPHLESLSVDTWNLTTWGLSDAARKLTTKFKHLRVRCIINHLDHGFFATLAKCCPNMRSLSISMDGLGVDYGYSEVADGVTDKAIETFLTSCSDIEILELYKTKFITSATLEVLIQRISSGALPRLRQVVLQGIPGLDIEETDGVTQLKDRLTELLGKGFLCEPQKVDRRRHPVSPLDATALVTMPSVAAATEPSSGQLTLLDLWGR